MKRNACEARSLPHPRFPRGCFNALALCYVIAQLAIGAANVTRANAAEAENPKTGGAPEYYLQLISPGPTGLSTHNQKAGAAPYTVSIDDRAADVTPGRRTIRGVAKGMRNLAVICPAGRDWSMTQPADDGTFSVDVTIPDEAGPMPIDIFAWNTGPNDPNYTVNLSARVLLFVKKEVHREALQAPSQGPAAGMRLVWSEEFDKSLSVSSSRNRDATWFVGGKPSSTGSQYSDAFFVAASDHRDPFTIKDGFLRIRARHDDALHDPTGWGRKWWSGHLSTGFPDGSASLEFREGYAEVRMMTPLGAGTWPAFWMLDSASTVPTRNYGAVEVDVVEAYGHDQTWYMATQHRWPGRDPKSGPHQFVEQRVRVDDGANKFHTYGIRLTKGESIWYLDGKEVFRSALYRSDIVSPFFLMLNLSMGGGWPIAVPPSNYYDLWIDYVRVYQ